MKTENENDLQETPTDTAPKSDILDGIGDMLADSMPEVQEHAINEEMEKQEKTAEQWAHLRDTDGNSFDPNQHKTDKNGNPTVTKLGKLIKKPGRKPGQNTASVVNPPKSQEPDPQAAARIQSRTTGKMAANLLITFGVVAGGEEWQPVKHEQTGIDEKHMLETAFADYFEATGKTDMPPGMALTVAIVGYAAPRFTMPKTKTRLGKIKGWIAKKIADRKLRKHGLKTESVDNE